MEKKDKERVLKIVHATEMFTPAEIFFAEEQIGIYLNQQNQRDYYLVVIENENHQVVGYMSYGPTPLTEGTYDLYWMAVVPEEQGRGYGRKLVSWLEECVKKANGRIIIIETSSQPKYQPTRQFYIRLGYKEVSRITDFYKPGDDRIIYTKYLA